MNNRNKLKNHIDKYLIEHCNVFWETLITQIDKMRDDLIKNSGASKVSVTYPSCTAIKKTWQNHITKYENELLSDFSHLNESEIENKIDIFYFFSLLGICIFHYSEESFDLKTLVHASFGLLQLDKKDQPSKETINNIARELHPTDDKKWLRDLDKRVEFLRKNLAERDGNN